MVVGPATDPLPRPRRYRRGMGQQGDPGGGSRRTNVGAAGRSVAEDEILEHVSKVVLAVSSQVSVRDVLQMIVRSARSLAGARYAALGVPDDAGGFAEFLVDGLTAAEQAAIGPLPRHHGLLGVMLREGEPLRLADIRADSRFWGWPAAHPELTEVLAVPIRDRDQILGFIFAANKIEPGGFTGQDERLISLFAAHAAIALTNARLYERGRELSVLQERARLARDLHDAVSQKLFSVRAKARAAAVLVQRDPARAVEEIDSVADLAGQAHAELRAVIDGLAPPDLAVGGLAGSIRGYAVLAGRTHGADVVVQAGELPGLDPVQQTALYRTAQEAIGNALRHSGSQHVHVNLYRRRNSVVLEVTDCGVGFDPRATSPGLGLASMRERAASVGGRLSITASTGAGSRVRLSIPLGSVRKAGPTHQEGTGAFEAATSAAPAASTAAADSSAAATATGGRP
jgi:signal transduction histidine kinase